MDFLALISNLLSLLLMAISLGLFLMWRKAQQRFAHLQREHSAQLKTHEELLGRHIAEQKKAAEELARERDLLHTLLDNMPDQIYFKDLNSHFLKVNPGVARTLGIKSPEEAVGKSDFDYFREEDAAAFRADDQQVMATAQPLLDRIERGIVHGVETWMSTTKAPIFDKQGKAVGIVGISRDITERKRAQAALHKVVDHARCVLWDAHVSESHGKTDWTIQVHSSDTIRREFRLDDALRRKILWTDQVPPEQMQRMNQTVWEALSSGASGYQQEFCVITIDGRTRWLKEDVQIEKLSPTSWELFGVAMDVTERKLIEGDLAKERDLLQALMDNVPDNIYFKDAASRFIKINSFQARHIGLDDPAKAIGKTDEDFYSAELAREFALDDKRILAGERIIGKVERHSREGAALRWMLSSKVPFHDRSGKIIGIVGVSKDITTIKAMERQLEDANEKLNKLACEDALTGLLNRRMILELADNEWARWQRYHKPFALLVIDADDFKAINDTYGHLAGDQALRLLANGIKHSIRAVDMLGRYGGEEFIVILPETNLEGATSAAENIVQHMRNKVLQVEHHSVRVTVSIGIAASASSDKNIDAILNRADKALYGAKSAGKNRVSAA